MTPRTIALGQNRSVFARPGPSKGRRGWLLTVMALGTCAVSIISFGGTRADAVAVDYGIASSMEQLRPGAAVGGRPSIAGLTAARNETESFQVLIAGPLTGVSVGGDPFGWETTSIHRMAEHVVTEPSDREGAVGGWWDALIPEVDVMYGENRTAFPVDIAANATLGVWVDVHVPPGTAAGTYAGSLQITANEGTAAIPVSIEVLAIDLPSTSTLRSAFYMTYNGANDDPVCIGHTGSSNCNGDGALRRELYTLYSHIALENRVTLANGSGLRYDQSPAAYTNAAWETGYEAPIIAGSSRVPVEAEYRLDGAAATTVSVFSYANFHCLALCVTQWNAEATEPVSPFGDRFVLYGCDEPNNNAALWQSCATNLASARTAWPTAPALVTATIGQYNTYVPTAGMPPVQILVPPINRIHDRPGQALGGDQRSTYDGFLATPGNEVWLYTSCLSHGCGGDDFGSPSAYWDGWPGYAVDAPAVQSRAMGWMAWRYRSLGELYYSADQRLATAWSTAGQFEAGVNGDGTLFYPGPPSIIGGTRHIPIESVRLKRIRDGREDHELMTWLAAQGEGDAVNQIVGQLFPTAYSAVGALDGTGAGTLLDARDQLLGLARSLLPPPPPPPAQVGPAYIAYADNRDGDFEVYRILETGGTPQQLTSNGVNDRFPAWSPDGRRIAWTSGSDVWVMNADGTGKANLTGDIDAATEKPAWSPDGQTIVFVRSDGEFTDIWKMNADGSAKTPLVTYASGGISSYDPAVDASGRVVFNLGEDLYRVNLNGTGFGPLVTGASVDEVVDIGPLTDRLSFSRSVGGQPYDVMVSDTTGGSVVNVTNRPAGDDFQSSWSPTEERIAYVSNAAGTFDIWVIDADGTDAAALLSIEGAQLDPDWGPPMPALVPNDFDGDGSSDRVAFRPEVGGWYVQGQEPSFLGLPSDVPVPGDYDGDRAVETAVYRSGAWYVEGQTTTYLGLPSDVPVPGDYDGDGSWERAVYRDGVWYVDGEPPFYLGADGDVPVPGDYDGDGTWERAVYRPSVGGWYVEGHATSFHGLPTDVPVPGDLDGDGTWERAVFRPSVGGWYLDGAATVFLGLSGDVPVAGDYDGDGTWERAVFRPAFGGWYVEGAQTEFHGLSSDVPIGLPQAVYLAYF